MAAAVTAGIRWKRRAKRVGTSGSGLRICDYVIPKETRHGLSISTLEMSLSMDDSEKLSLKQSSRP